MKPSIAHGNGNDRDQNQDQDEEDEFDYSDEDYDDDDDDDEDYASSEEAADLPEIVREEIDRRKRGESWGLPHPLVVHALRQYFETGKGDPQVAGGFMALMREIGAVAQSKDHLVKHSEHNIWYFGAKGEEDSSEWWQDQLERHESEVRLLRYGEFMEMQEIKGLSFESHWRFVELEDKENLVGDDLMMDETTREDDDCMTEDQMVGLSKHFMASFWLYVNHEQIQDQSQHEDTTQGQNTSSASIKSNKVNAPQQDSEPMQQQWTEKAIRQKCGDLRDRYIKLRRPLGYNLAVVEQEPPSAAKKMSGKKQRKRHKQQQRAKPGVVFKKMDHADCIREHLQALLKLADRQLFVRPASASCARMVSSILDMLRAGVSADLDIARNLAKSATSLIALRNRAATFAVEADCDASRPLLAGNAWWEVFTVLTMLWSDIIVTLTGDKENRNEYRSTAATPLTADERLASSLFEIDLSPSLLRSIQSPQATERCVSLKAMGRIVCAVSVDLVMGLVKPKTTWDLLEKACMVPYSNSSSSSQSSSHSRSQRRDNIMAPRAAAQGTSLLIRLCGTGMVKEDTDETSGIKIVPGPLARKMIQRGIVPFLMGLSRSKLDLVSVDAVGGLAQVTCVKECRASLLQQPDCVEWLQTVLSSAEGHKVSQVILLLRHLLWDDEWLVPILAIKPPVEQTIIRWMAFCMKKIRERADETRIANKKMSANWRAEFIARSLSKMKLSEQTDKPGNPDQQDINAECEAMDDERKNKLTWNKLETEEVRTHITNLTLSRGVIFLSTLIRDRVTSERVLRANGLALAAACLDVPVDDTNSAAANMISNYLSTAGSVSPNVFPDPDHVVRAAISRLSRLVNRQDVTPRSFIFVRLLNGLRKNMDWAPFFQSCAEKDMEHKYVIEIFLPKIGDNIPGSTPLRGNDNARQTNSEKVNGRRPLNRKKPARMAHKSSKLNSCDYCGVKECKLGEFKKCSQCNVTYYCGRQCQTDDWKKHKKECPALALAAKAKSAKKSTNMVSSKKKRAYQDRGLPVE